jgi:hypothetical protein
MEHLARSMSGLLGEGIVERRAEDAPNHRNDFCGLLRRQLNPDLFCDENDHPKDGVEVRPFLTSDGSGPLKLLL